MNNILMDIGTIIRFLISGVVIKIKSNKFFSTELNFEVYKQLIRFKEGGMKFQNLHPELIKIPAINRKFISRPYKGDGMLPVPINYVY
jgi:hypothetical protein